MLSRRKGSRVGKTGSMTEVNIREIEKYFNTKDKELDSRIRGYQVTCPYCGQVFRLDKNDENLDKVVNHVYSQGCSQCQLKNVPTKVNQFKPIISEIAGVSVEVVVSIWYTE